MKEVFGSMAESRAQVRERRSQYGLRGWLRAPLCLLAAEVLSDRVGRLPPAAWFAAALWVEAVVEYWIPPRPPVSFGAWTFRLSCVVGVVLLGFWIVPALASHAIPRRAAYGVCGFAAFLIIYWLPPIMPGKRERRELWVWLLLSVVMGVCAAWGWGS